MAILTCISCVSVVSSSLAWFVGTDDDCWWKNVFEDVFVLFSLLLDKIWVERNASYMDYSNITKETRARFEQALAQRPTNIKMLAQLLQIDI